MTCAEGHGEPTLMNLLELATHLHDLKSLLFTAVFP